MNAIKPSWTRSPQPFALRLKRSQWLDTALYTVAASITLLTLFSPIDIASKLVCLSVTYVMFCIEYRNARTHNTDRVIRFSPSGVWSYYLGNIIYSGSIGRQSYRCRWFVVLALTSTTAKTRFVLVPRDSTDSRGFSLLQTHLKFPIQAVQD